MKSIGDKIAIARKNKNLSQSDVARKVNITPQMVSKWEREESLPDVVMLGKLAEILEVSIFYFYDDKTNVTPIPKTNEVKQKSRAKLNDHKWKGNDFSNSNLTDLDFAFAKFVECNFAGCDMTKRDLRYAEFMKCTLDDANLVEVQAFRTDIIDTSIIGTKFSSSTFDNSDFKNCIFKDCIFVNTIFDKTKFKGCIFENCTADKKTYNFLLACKVNTKEIKAV